MNKVPELNASVWRVSPIKYVSLFLQLTHPKVDLLFRLMLTVSEADAGDSGTFTCAATKDGVTATTDFTVDVHMPIICTHKDGTEFEHTTTYSPNQVNSSVWKCFQPMLVILDWFPVNRKLSHHVCQWRIPRVLGLCLNPFKYKENKTYFNVHNPFILIDA